MLIHKASLIIDALYESILTNNELASTVELTTTVPPIRIQAMSE